MNHILDVLRRLVDSKPMNEAEQEAAHGIITATEDALTAALGHADIGKAIKEALDVPDDQETAHAEQLGATAEGHGQAPLEAAPAGHEE